MLTFLSWINIILLVLLWLIQTQVAERNWLGTLVTYAPQFPFGLPLLVLLFISVIKRKSSAIKVNTAGALFFLFAFMGFRWSLWQPPAKAEYLRVMTYNIHQGRAGVEHIVKEIREENPDVVCLQEANVFGAWQQLTPSLKKSLSGYRVIHYDEIAIASRYPVVKWSMFPLRRQGARRVAIEAVINTRGRNVTIINVHLMTSPVGESIMTHDSTTKSYLKKTADVRFEQVGEIIKRSSQTKAPLIIAGDFNTPPRGLLYTQLTSKYMDSFSKVGRGFGYTFRADYPVVRIDYVFTANGAYARNAYVPKALASDHRPMVADIIIGRVEY